MNRLSVACALLGSVIWSGASCGASLQEGLADCAAVTEDIDRLRCYDRLSAKPPPVASREEPIGTERAARETPPLPDGDWLAGQTKSAPGAKSRKKGLWLGFRPYRRNYILPVTYNSRLNRDLLEGAEGGFSPEDIEIKFQLSFELPLWEKILGYDLDLYFAYTQLSFFQAYNTEYSSPFRDTSYEPEMGLNWKPGLEFMGWELESVRLALDHQSNGRTEPLSRSWNRLLGQFRLRRGDLDLGLRAWERFREEPENDDNPDIIDYLGYGELFAGYDRGRHRFGLMVRNPARHIGLQLDWSYLLTENVRFYVQYFNGHGESLLDYDRQVNRIGAGFSLNEWP